MLGGRLRHFFSAVCLWAGLALTANAAETIQPAKLIPDWALAYLEISRPEQLLEPALQPKLWEMFSGSKDVQNYLASENYQKLSAAVGDLESKLGAKWPDLVRGVGGSVHLAFDPVGNGVLLIVRAKKPELLPKLHQVLIDLTEAEAAKQGRESPVKSKEYRGYTGYTFGGNEALTIIDDLLIVASKPDMLRSAVDRLKDGGRSLLDAADYQQARAQVPAGETAWGMLRLTPLRLLPKFNQVITGKNNNPVAELLVGGILDTLRSAAVVTSSLHVDADRVRWRVALPREGELSKSRGWYFASEAGQSAFTPLRPKGTIATITTYRDIAGLWALRDDLFDEATAANLTQADTNLGLFFAGRDFGTQVLGELSPRWQLVFTRQQYSADAPIPAVKLPAAALIVEMKNPARFSAPLTLAYQKIIGTVNLVGGMQGQPQLLLSTEEYKGVTISKSAYLVEPDAETKDAAINYNASPSCAAVGSRFIFGSTTGIVRDLVDLLKTPEALKTNSDNTLLELDVQESVAALADNLNSLISQNMLEEGNKREEAEKNVAGLLTLLRLVKNGSLRLVAEPKSLVLETSIGLNLPSSK